MGALLLVSNVVTCAQQPSSPFGEPCSLESCECAGYCMSAEKGKVIDTPAGEDGYGYRFSLCTTIPDKDLPSGCKGIAPNATAVRYKVRSNNAAARDSSRLTVDHFLPRRSTTQEIVCRSASFSICASQALGLRRRNLVALPPPVPGNLLGC